MQSPVPFESSSTADVLSGLFGTEEMRAIFGERALLARYIETEIALAQAQAELGIIPAAAAKIIAEKATIDLLDIAKLRSQTKIVGYPILPLVEQLAAALGEAGQHLHWGATTQDIMDTATVLQVRAALDHIERDLNAVADLLCGLAERYRNAPMAGRTHLQQALPVTFGYKAAVWLSMMDRHVARLGQLRPRLLVAQLGGAAGTLASLGTEGLAVRDAFAKKLGLAPRRSPGMSQEMDWPNSCRPWA